MPMRTSLLRLSMRALLLATTASTLRAQIAAPTSLARPTQGAAPTQAAKFFLDYDVPESPAFALLGATPTNVLRAGAAKPAVISLANNLARSGRLATGISIDVAPYAYFGRFRNVDVYKRSALKRFFANALISLATIQSPNDTNATAFAIGARATLHDDHDLLANSDLQHAVGQLLVPTTIECEKVPGTNICQAGSASRVVEVDVTPAYAAARDSVMHVKGWSASVGGALGGTLGGGVPRGDSLTQRTSHAWLAATRYLGVGHALLGIAEWVRDTSRANRLRTGVAYRMQSATSSIAAELAYDTGAGGVLPGVNAEMRILNRVTLIAALLTDVPGSAADSKRLRFKTGVRWSATEGF